MKRDRRGNIAILTAFLAIPLIGAVGIATDSARVWLLQSRLHTALDAAALAGARNINLPAAQRDAEVVAMFWTNFRPASLPVIAPSPGPGMVAEGFLGASTQLDMPAVVDGQTMAVSATSTLDTTFARILGVNTMTVRSTAQARRADLGMEVALVLDVTGSMDTNCGVPNDRTSAGCGVTAVPRRPGQTVTARNNNMDLLRVAAADLVNILYGDRDTVPNLWVSVVPYTTTANIGSGRANWLTAEAQATLGGSFRPTTWRGCVEARVGRPGNPADGDRADYTPAEAPFHPFLFRSTLGLYTLGGQRVPGDNDWDPNKAWTPTTTGGDAVTEDYQLWRGNYQVGPNVGCPQTPILPLTASKTAVLDTLQSLRPTFRGGTMANLGLQAGWFTLSPRWRAAWALGPAPAGQASALPLDYRTRFMRKVIVLMTDGNNNWFDSPAGYPGACTETTPDARSFPTTASGVVPPGPAQGLRQVACPTQALAGTNNVNIQVAAGAPPIANNADYTGYGRISDRRLGSAVTNNAQATAELNNRMASLCTAIKRASGRADTIDDIIIYAVILDTSGTATNAATRNLYENCASSPQNFFLVTQPDQLRPAFQQIGTQLANLRLVR
jgi:Flp pilus assembly protein TadG